MGDKLSARYLSLAIIAAGAVLSACGEIENVQATNNTSSFSTTPERCLQADLQARIDTYAQQIQSELVPTLTAQIQLANLRCEDQPQSRVCADFTEVQKALLLLNSNMHILRAKHVTINKNGLPESSCTDELYWNNVAYGNLQKANMMLAQCVQTGLCKTRTFGSTLEMSVDTQSDALVKNAETAAAALEKALKTRRDRLE
ncbi:MAG: hypothetical protein AAFP97_13720 [Pseudomonadota bacterium]